MSGLTQNRIKRLFADSTISHIGFILLALSINSLESIKPLNLVVIFTSGIITIHLTILYKFLLVLLDVYLSYNFSSNFFGLIYSLFYSLYLLNILELCT